MYRTLDKCNEGAVHYYSIDKVVDTLLLMST